MNKLLGAMLVVLGLSGCGGDKVVYIDSNTGKVAPPPVQSMEVLVPIVVCIGGVQYYKQDVMGGGYLTPRTTLGAGNNLVGYSCGS